MKALTEERHTGEVPTVAVLMEEGHTGEVPTVEVLMVEEQMVKCRLWRC